MEKQLGSIPFHPDMGFGVASVSLSVKVLRPAGGLGFPRFLVGGRLAVTALQVALKTSEAAGQSGRKKSDRTGRMTVKGRKATDRQ